MRARLLLILIAILVVAGFTAINWTEFMRPAPLSFGLVVAEAPLGLILLGLLVLGLVAFLLSSTLMQSQNLLEHRRYAKELQLQRDLADKAEASRFTELRQHLDTHLLDYRQREAISASEFEKAMVQSQRELRIQLDLMNKTLANRLGELEGRIDSRLNQRNQATTIL